MGEIFHREERRVHERDSVLGTTVARSRTTSFILRQVHAAGRVRSGNGRRLAALLPAEDVDDVDLAVGVLPAHVGPHVRRVLRTEGTVRAVEPRRLTARELEMMLKIVAPIEGSAASRAVIHLLAGLPWMLGLMGRSIRAASASRVPRRLLAF